MRVIELKENQVRDSGRQDRTLRRVVGGGSGRGILQSKCAMLQLKLSCTVDEYWGSNYADITQLNLVLWITEQGRHLLIWFKGCINASILPAKMRPAFSMWKNTSSMNVYCFSTVHCALICLLLPAAWCNLQCHEFYHT